MNKRTWIWVLWWVCLALVAATLLFPLFKFLRWTVNGYYHKIVTLPSVCMILSFLAWVTWFNRKLGFWLLLVFAMSLQIATIHHLRDQWTNFNPDYYWWPVAIALGVAGNCLAWSWLKKVKAEEENVGNGGLDKTAPQEEDH